MIIRLIKNYYPTTLGFFTSALVFLLKQRGAVNYRSRMENDFYIKLKDLIFLALITCRNNVLHKLMQNTRYSLMGRQVMI